MPAERGTADRVNAGSNSMQPARAEATFNLPPTEAEIEQLLPSHHIMLSFGELPRSARTPCLLG
jgi:hypothetical protein